MTAGPGASDHFIGSTQDNIFRDRDRMIPQVVSSVLDEWEFVRLDEFLDRASLYIRSYT